MRPRTLVFLLVLTAGDYLLWDWSIADAHDILSLVAGLTLVPLAAVSVVGGLAAGIKLLTRSAARPPSRTRAAEASREDEASGGRQGDASTSRSDSSSSGRLAA